MLPHVVGHLISLPRRVWGIGQIVPHSQESR